MANKIAGGVKAGSTALSLLVDLDRTDGTGELTGVAAGSVTAGYLRPGGAVVPIPVTALGTLTAAWSAGGWFEVGSTTMKGSYRLDVPDAAFATGADWVRLYVLVAGAFVWKLTLALESKGAYEVSQVLPGVAAGAAGGLPLGDANGRVDVGAVNGSPATLGDPLATAVPGSYSAGTAGYLIGTNLNATVASRSTFAGGAVASVAGTVNATLVPAGLDAIATTLPAGASSGWNFRQMLVWLFRRMARAGKTPTALSVLKPDGTALTTQAVTDDGAGTQTMAELP